MATIGKSLTAPEAGWKRYDDRDSNIAYVGNWAHGSDGPCYNGTYMQSNVMGSSVKFNFTGTKFRFIGAHYSDKTSSADISIDGIKIATINQYGSLTYQVVECESIGLANTEHYVLIVNNSTGGLCVDAIDIETTGTIKPYNPNIVSIISSPTNLTATTGELQVSLSWVSVTGATSYNIKRSTILGGPYTTIASSVIGTSYVDTAVANGTTYYYIVTAIDENGNESASSNEVSATPKSGTVTPPTGNALLRVTMIDSSEREYRLTSTEITGFINWYTRTIGTGISCYAVKDIVDNSTEYLAFEKIISFKVMELTK